MGVVCRDFERNAQADGLPLNLSQPVRVARDERVKALNSTDAAHKGPDQRKDAKSEPSLSMVATHCRYPSLTSTLAGRKGL